MSCYLSNTSVWGEPTHNFWITALMGTINRYISLKTPPAGAPGMFRCAKPGFMTTLFGKAGLSKGIEKAIDGEMYCNSTDEYWSFMNDVVPPVVALFSESEVNTVAKIKREVYQLIEEKIPGKEKNISSGARLFTAVKPV